jgi:hypothetical protein
MLSADPEKRPLDPLALYAQLRGCLPESERHAAIARSFATQAALETKAIEKQERRPFPTRALAVAALLLAFTLAALVLPERLGFRQAKQIGVPIGIPEAEAPPASKVALPDHRLAAQQSRPGTLVAITNTNEAAENNTPDEASEIGAVPVSSGLADQDRMVTVGKETTDPARINAYAAETAPLPSNDISASETGSEPVERPGAPKAGSEVVASANRAASVPLGASSSPVDADEEKSAAVAANNVPPAEKRAEPVSPAEEAGGLARNSSAVSPVAPSSNRTASIPRGSPSTEHDARAQQPAPLATNTRPATTEAPEPEPPMEGPVNSAGGSEQSLYSGAPTGGSESESVLSPPAAAAPSAPRSDAAKTATVAKSTKLSKKGSGKKVAKVTLKRDRALPRAPRGTVRARFVGMTSDGRLVLELPSSRRVIVPAPQPSSYR